MGKINLTAVIFLCISALVIASNGYCAKEMGGMKMGIFEKVSKEVKAKDGVKEISYEQFMSIRNSGERYILVDVLSPDSYSQGHIKGAISFPMDTINKQAVAKMLPKGTNVIVYCGSFQCGASTASAKKLSGFGYNVLDYKGGLKEWQEKGNRLVK